MIRNVMKRELAGPGREGFVFVVGKQPFGFWMQRAGMTVGNADGPKQRDQLPIRV